MSRARIFCNETNNSWKFMIQIFSVKKKDPHYAGYKPLPMLCRKEWSLEVGKFVRIIHHILRESGHKICG